MRSIKKFGAVLLMLVMGVPAFAHKPVTKKSSLRSSHLSRVRRSNWKRHGQQAIASDRAREIQEALIREHYLDGQPNGIWDARTTAAMRRFQAAQGWQTKVVPDSRALIKLGLGPSHENDLNPDLMGDKAVFTPLRAAESNTADISQR